MRTSPCYIGMKRIFLPEQVFGHRNNGNCGHLPIWEHVGRGKIKFRPQVTFLVRNISVWLLSQNHPPKPLSKPAFRKKGKGCFTMLMSSSAHVRLLLPDTKPEEPRQIPRQTMLFPSPPTSFVGPAQPYSRDIYGQSSDWGQFLRSSPKVGGLWESKCYFPTYL